MSHIKAICICLTYRKSRRSPKKPRTERKEGDPEDPYDFDSYAESSEDETECKYN